MDGDLAGGAERLQLDRPVKAYGWWMVRIPQEYRGSVLDEPNGQEIIIAKDPHCLATLVHYRRLMPLAQGARKPMFFLKPTDGAIGSHSAAVRGCHEDFRVLAGHIAGHCRFAIP